MKLIEECSVPNIRLMIAIYERNEGDAEPAIRGGNSVAGLEATYVLKTPAMRISKKRWRINAPSYPRHLFPKKGDLVSPGSIVETVRQTRQPVFLRKVTGFDFWGLNDLTVLARPVLWYGELAKVILLMLGHEHGALVQPQLDSLNPTVIPISYQMI